MKQIRFKISAGNEWTRWYKIDKAIYIKDIQAIETKETMTLKELKKYPDLYEKALKTVLSHPLHPEGKEKR